MTRSEKVAKSLILEFASAPGRIAPLGRVRQSPLGPGSGAAAAGSPSRDWSGMGRVARPLSGLWAGGPRGAGLRRGARAEERRCPRRSRPGFAGPGARGGGRAVSAHTGTALVLCFSSGTVP